MNRKLILVGLLIAASASATTVYQVTGPSGANWSASTTQILYGSWTQSGSYSNVSISAFVSNGSSAYLTNLIGGTATAGNVIASTTFSVGGATLTQLFSGLSLGPGTYYLVIGGTVSGTWPEASPPTVTTDAGVTANGYGFCNTTGYGSCNFANPYASTFVASSLNSQFLVDGTADGVPEPATLGTMASALLALAGWGTLRRRKSRPAA